MTAPASARERVRRQPGILSQRVDDQLVLLNPHDGQYFALDEVGGMLWDLCDGTLTISDIAAAIAREYDAPTDVIETDIRELLHDLVDEKLATLER
jgi:pyrroloquinoline quinone biosynthesis protein D